MDIYNSDWINVDNNNIHSTAIIYPNVIIGKNVYIGAYCIIGAPAENIKTWGDMNHKVIIGDNTKITGHVTIDSGVESDTVIGSDCFIMKGTHIGHDCKIGDGTILSPHVLIGGYCSIGSGCKFGMGAIVRNRKTIPNEVTLGMGAVVTKSSELWSGGTFVGVPAIAL